MVKINKVLITFLTFVLVMSLLVWRVIQSQYFSDFVRGKVTVLMKEEGIKGVDFKNIEFQVFPPAVALKGFSYKDETIDLKLDRVVATFNIAGRKGAVIDLLSIVGQDGVLTLDDELLKANDKKTNDIDVTATISSIISTDLYSIDKIQIKDVVVKTKIAEGFVNDLSLENKGELKLYGEINEVRIDQYSLDAIELDLLLEGKKLVVKSGFIKKDLDYAQLRGFVDVNNKVFFSKVNAQLFAYSLNQLIDESIIQAGILSLENVEVNGEFDGGVALEGDVEAYDFVSDFLDVQKGRLYASYQDGLLWAQKARISHYGQVIKHEKKFQVYDVENKKIIPSTLEPEFEGARLSFLKFLSEELSDFNAEVTGALYIDRRSDDTLISFDSSLDVENFQVNLKADDPLLSIKRAKIIEGAINAGSDIVELGFLCNYGDEDLGQLSVDARFDESGIDVKIISPSLILEDLGPISGVDVQGAGTGEVQIQGKEDISVFVDLKVSDARFIDFYLGKVSSKITVSTKDSYLKLNETTGSLKRSTYNVDGGMDLDSGELDFFVGFSSASYEDLYKVHESILKNVPYSSLPVTGKLSLSYNIMGKPSLEDLNVIGKINGKNNIVQGEYVNSFGFDFEFRNQVFAMYNGEVELGGGIARYGLNFKMQDDHLSYFLSANEINLNKLAYTNELPMGKNGKFKGALRGEVDQKGMHSFKYILNLYDYYVEGRKLKNSRLFITSDGSKVDYSLGLHGKDIKIDGSHYLIDSNKKSHVAIESNIASVNNILLILMGKAGESIAMDGQLNLLSRIEYYSHSKRIENFYVDINKILLISENNNFSYIGPSRVIEVKNYKINEWDFSIDDDDLLFKTKGAGDFKEQFSVDIGGIIPASVIEAFNSSVIQSAGGINYNVSLTNDDIGGVFSSEDLYLNIEDLPLPLNNISFTSFYEKGRLMVNNTKITFPEGEMHASGSLFFGSRGKPSLNFLWELRDVGYSLKNRSSSTVYGKGAVNGSEPPYTIEGDIFMRNTYIYNEFEDFQGGDISRGMSEYQKLLPDLKDKKITDNFVYRLGVNVDNPIVINNSTYEMQLQGGGRLLGTIQSPTFEGKISIVPGTSRMFFKNNNFDFSQGDIIFEESRSLFDPLIQFRASSKIANYSLFVEATGAASDPVISFESQPSLSQESILSLIAFGYTESLSYSLTEEDRQNLSSVGIGSILFDRFKVNTALKETLGLQLSLGTELQESHQSLLERAGSTSSEEVGRYRSATKVELRKRISEKIDLSLSSTVSSDVNQSRKMNMNYQFSDQVSVDGVFELKNNVEGQEQIDDRSIGADLKVRWTFE